LYLYHYFDIFNGPFKNLSELNVVDAKIIQDNISKNKIGFAAQRNDNYIERRFELENMAYNIFISKGGKPKSKFPHYFVVEECNWLESWYENSNYIKINIENINKAEISFTYGDLFPTFSEKVKDNKEYRKNVYTYDGIIKLINKYGLPQEWNSDGEYGPERYIEAHLWNNKINDIINNGIYKIRATST
jgi:hypothetical protein